MQTVSRVGDPGSTNFTVFFRFFSSRELASPKPGQAAGIVSPRIKQARGVLLGVSVQRHLGCCRETPNNSLLGNLIDWFTDLRLTSGGVQPCGPANVGPKESRQQFSFCSRQNRCLELQCGHKAGQRGLKWA